MASCTLGEVPVVSMVLDDWDNKPPYVFCYIDGCYNKSRHKKMMTQLKKISHRKDVTGNPGNDNIKSIWYLRLQVSTWKCWIRNLKIKLLDFQGAVNQEKIVTKLRSPGPKVKKQLWVACSKQNPKGRTLGLRDYLRFAIQVIHQAVTFWSSIVEGHKQPLKGSLNHPEKVTKNCQDAIFSGIPFHIFCLGWKFPERFHALFRCVVLFLEISVPHGTRNIHLKIVVPIRWFQTFT